MPLFELQKRLRLNEGARPKESQDLRATCASDISTTGLRYELRHEFLSTCGGFVTGYDRLWMPDTTLELPNSSPAREGAGHCFMNDTTYKMKHGTRMERTTLGFRCGLVMAAT